MSADLIKHVEVLSRAENLPDNIVYAVKALLYSGRITDIDELNVVKSFIDAVDAVCLLPHYEEVQDSHRFEPYSEYKLDWGLFGGDGECASPEEMIPSSEDSESIPSLPEDSEMIPSPEQIIEDPATADLPLNEA